MPEIWAKEQNSRYVLLVFQQDITRLDMLNNYFNFIFDLQP